MEINNVITLEDGSNSLILEKVNFEDTDYFMAVVLNEEEEPSDKYICFSVVNENDENFAEIIEDKDLLAQLLPLFTNNVNKFINNLPEDI